LARGLFRRDGECDLIHAIVVVGVEVSNTVTVRCPVSEVPFHFEVLVVDFCLKGDGIQGTIAYGVKLLDGFPVNDNRCGQVSGIGADQIGISSIFSKTINMSIETIRTSYLMYIVADSFSGEFIVLIAVYSLELAGWY
jgi:hypothetical protein